MLFVSLCNDPGSDRIVAEMGRLGADCALIAPKSSFAAQSRFSRRVYPLAEWGGAALRSLQLGMRLDAIVRDARPDAIVPLDDLAARALRDGRLYRRAGPELRRLLASSLGAPEHFETACSRQGLFEVASRLGVRGPRTAVAADLAAARRAAAEFGYPVVLKREQSAGGGGVAIARDPPALERAFRNGWIVAQTKRRLGWIYGFRLAEPAPLILQEFVAGDLAFRVSACADGVELEGADFVAERRDPWDTRSSSRVRGVSHDEMQETTRTIIGALKLSGIVSLDFILGGDDKAHLLELNARPIACGHLGRLFGHDILSAALGRGEAPRQSLSPPPRAIALFPLAVDRDPESPDLTSSSAVYHDVPWEDPEVIAAYAAWLDRRRPDRRPRQDLRSVIQPHGMGSA